MNGDTKHTATLITSSASQAVPLRLGRVPFDLAQALLDDLDRLMEHGFGQFTVVVEHGYADFLQTFSRRHKYKKP